MTDSIDLGSEFRLWPLVVLRSAGFACDAIKKLASTETARTVEHFLQMEDEVERRHELAVARCIKELDACKGADKMWVAALRRVKRRRVDAEEPFEEERIWRDSLPELERARMAIAETVERDDLAGAEAFQLLVNDNRFREATMWSNPSAVATGFERIKSDEANAKQRSKERYVRRKIALYLQRFTTKCESIGFFGPIGYAWLDPTGDAVTMQAGPTVETAARVSFENWALVSLAQRMNADEGVFAHAPVRRSPRVSILETGAFVGLSPLELSDIELAIVRAADGRISFGALTSSLVDAKDARDVAQVEKLVRALAERGIIEIGFTVPVDRPNAEVLLREEVARIPDGDARARALALLSRLEEARERVRVAMSKGDKLQEALAAADNDFVEHVGTAASRGAGAAYTGRRVLYFDSRRDVSVSLGAPIIRALAPTLELLSLSARWLSHAVSMAFLDIATNIFNELLANRSTPSIPYLELHDRLVPHFRRLHIDPVPPFSVRAQAELQRRWAEILKLREDERERVYTTAELREAVRTAFEAPHSGAPALSHHCPDVMIAARGRDAIRRGEFRAVLGEMHNGFHTFMKPLFTSPMTPSELDWTVKAYEADLAGGAVVTPLVRAADSYTRVAHPPRFRDADVVLETGLAKGGPPVAGVLTLANLVAERLGDVIRVRDTSSLRTYSLAEMLGIPMRFAMPNSLEILESRAHIPRVIFDDVVVTRESWTFDTSDLRFAAHDTAAERFTATSRWRRTHQLPRYVFMKSPKEVKPVFVDFDSLTFVDVFCATVRAADRIRVTEMLPSIEDTWLEDAHGATYVCELRMACADMKRPERSP